MPRGVGGAGGGAVGQKRAGGGDDETEKTRRRVESMAEGRMVAVAVWPGLFCSGVAISI